MATSHVNLVNLVAASVYSAKSASKIICDVMKKGELGIVDKGINDLQTEADRSAQHCIVSGLTKQFPGIKIIGEETLDTPGTTGNDVIDSGFDESVISLVGAKCPERLKNIPLDDLVVWVDPLDGTAEYTKGLLDHVTTLIGIAVKGEPLAGVICQPYYNFQKVTGTTGQSIEGGDCEPGVVMGRTVWGIQGIGAFGHEKNTPPPFEDGLIVTVSASHPTESLTKCLQALNPSSVFNVGGAGHKVLMLLDGKAHVYPLPTRGCKKWDTCAPEAVLRAAGGIITDMFGKDIEYHQNVTHSNESGHLAALDRRVHAHCLQVIPEDLKPKVKSTL